MKTIVVMVCHPDDEIIWAGNMLIQLSNIGWNIHILSLSRSPDPDRNRQFYEVCEKSGFIGYLAEQYIPAVTHCMGDIGSILSEYLVKNAIQNPDLVLTHSPYGDEYTHPHHVDCFKKMHLFCRQKKISLAFFSPIKLPIYHLPLLKNIHRHHGLIMHDMGKVFQSLYYLLNRIPFFSKYKNVYTAPKYYIDFAIEKNHKKENFRIYESVGVEVHIKNYISLSMPVENIYFMDKKGMMVFEKWFSSDREKSLYQGFENIFYRIFRKIQRRIGHGS